MIAYRDEKNKVYNESKKVMSIHHNGETYLSMRI
ncbi:hypothetical protein BCF50_3523 [Chryseobacterium daecheongense]|uniref:Uncharacterized protein n=1 Tax=Chryseobacterium daecheongense TaxID=192389 RepID=A0ABY2FRW0_9FLAO|nr:hypothetical protein BCF50_3523 [Chryseobacterium daecheongense]